MISRLAQWISPAHRVEIEISIIALMVLASVVGVLAFFFWLGTLVG